MAGAFVLGLLLILSVQSHESVSTEGSGYELTANTVSSPSSILLTSASATDVPMSTTNATYILNLSFETIVNFLKEHMFPVIVIGSLVLLLVFIICTAVICSQKKKASAYYPSSFPKKKYVDEKDKSGGKKTLDEIPEKNVDVPHEEPISSTKRLEADILAATNNLKSPTKEQQMTNGKETKLEIIDETATKNEIGEVAENIVLEQSCTEAGENKESASQGIMMENLQLDKKEKDAAEEQKNQDASPAPEDIKEAAEATMPTTEAATSQSDNPSTSDTQNGEEPNPSC